MIGGMLMAEKKTFAAVPQKFIDYFLADLDASRIGSKDLDPNHYDEKALTLFLLIRFCANSSFDFYTNEFMLCELLGISTRMENRNSVMANIRRMENDEILEVRYSPGKKFFRITLNYEACMQAENFVKIYKEEFDSLLGEKSRDKLFLLLYCIKKFQYGKSGISFPSIETLIDSSHISKPTILKGLEALNSVLYVCKVRINFNDGTNKDVNYYQARAVSNGISFQAVETIIRKYYRNVKSIIERK